MSGKSSEDCLAQLRVLVVDDNVDQAGTTAWLLKLSGHEVHVAHDGSAALDAARRCHPEYIFLDIGLPGMDGYEVARLLRADPAFAATRIIAVTGYGRAEDHRRSLGAGIDLHLLKPLDPAFLESLLGRR